jgi:hypothetical protein
MTSDAKMCNDVFTCISSVAVTVRLAGRGGWQLCTTADGLADARCCIIDRQQERAVGRLCQQQHERLWDGVRGRRVRASGSRRALVSAVESGMGEERRCCMRPSRVLAPS